MRNFRNIDFKKAAVNPEYKEAVVRCYNESLAVCQEASKAGFLFKRNSCVEKEGKMTSALKYHMRTFMKSSRYLHSAFGNSLFDGEVKFDSVNTICMNAVLFNKMVSEQIIEAEEASKTV